MADRALLRLLAWLSPSFPTGGFAYSHGLEWAVDTGDIADETGLQAWLVDVLVHGSGRNDAILLRHAHRVVADPAALAALADPDALAALADPAALAALAELAAAMAPARERRTEALDQGGAFVAAATIWSAPPLPDRVPYAVAVGALAGAHGITEDDAAAAYLQTFTASLISAAVRLVPLGQSAGLRVLAALEPVILHVTGDTRSATLDDLGGCAFRSDLAAMRHETQYTRLFRS